MTSHTQLQHSDKQIEGANAAPITCYGKADLTITFGKFSCVQTFYVCEDDVSPLLGRDFMRSHDVYVRPARNAVFKDGAKIPACDLAAKVNNRVTLINNIFLKPGQEIQTVGNVVGKRRADDVTCIFNPNKTLFTKTGATAARVLTTPTNRSCCVRLLNPHDVPVRLWAGQTVG